MTPTVSKMENVAPIRSAHWANGPVCFKCEFIDLKKGSCSANPAKAGIKGDAGLVCDLFKLDRSRWHTPHTQEWEWRNKAHGQMKLEDWA